MNKTTKVQHEKKRWTQEQLERLRQGYPDDDIDKLAFELEHSRSATIKMANVLGVKRSASAISACKKAVAKPNSGSFRPKHGRAGDGVTRNDPTYRTWLSMNQRCNYPGHKSYATYGGKGISVCERWKSFENFLADMGERPVGMTLDRYPNIDGNYEPSNCRWATNIEQSRNRRTNRLISYEGRQQTLVAWAEEYEIRQDTLANRLKSGWSVHDALTRPVAKFKRAREGDRHLKAGEQIDRYEGEDGLIRIRIVNLETARSRHAS